MTTKDFASQILQQPIGVGELVFRPDWLMRYSTRPDRASMNVYILIDSANAKRTAKGGSDYTVMEVWGYGLDKKRYLLDAIRERLSLAERTQKLFELVEKWAPNGIFWEQVGAMSDVEHVRLEQDRINWHFSITQIHQDVPKFDRINWLEPPARNGDLWFPYNLWRRGADGEAYDFMEKFEREEFIPYPSVQHDDMLDCAANLYHQVVQANTKFPVAPAPPNEPAESETYSTEWRPEGW